MHSGIIYKGLVNSRNLTFVVFLAGFCNSISAQLSERFVVNNVSDKTSAANESYNQVVSCNAADLLMALGCYREAADMYSTLIDQFKLQGDTVNLDRACTGLYRAQLLSNTSGKYTDSLAKCRPELIDPLMGKVDWEPMFINVPVFEPDVAWLNSAAPGAIYKVTVQFDIDEYGNADNFDFNADDKLLLRYPVIERLKSMRYFPAVKDGKAIKKSKNLVEVVFCLDRGTTCVNDN